MALGLYLSRESFSTYVISQKLQVGKKHENKQGSKVRWEQMSAWSDAGAVEVFMRAR